MVMETPSPQCVGREFVRQYYTLLHEAPQYLHRFYSHNSCFVHGGVEKPGEEQPPVTGQNDIHKKIMSLCFSDCHAKIRQVDSQATVGDAVVVQVTGELSNNRQPMRRFMQTFVLAPQSPKKYYVHNDIFRYQDEVFHDADTENEVQEETCDSEPDTLEPSSQSESAPHTEGPVTYYDTQKHLSSISNGNPVDESTDVIEEGSIAEEEQDSEQLLEETYETKYEEETDKLPTPDEQADEPPMMEPDVQKPFSWADRVSQQLNQQQNVSPSQSNNVNVPATTIKVKSVEPKAEIPVDQDNGTPQPQRTPKPPRIDRRERDSSRSGTTLNEGPDERGPRSRFPDSQQLFVGNLPHNIQDKELKNFFENKYGKVLEVRINRKSTNRDVPNFGFVVFEEPETVKQVLNSKPIMLKGEHRLNVEEKKQQNQRPGSGSRPQGRGVSSINNMRGGPPGSRGGGRGGGPGRSDNRGNMRGGGNLRPGFGQPSR